MKLILSIALLATFTPAMAQQAETPELTPEQTEQQFNLYCAAQSDLSEEAKGALLRPAGQYPTGAELVNAFLGFMNDPNSALGQGLEILDVDLSPEVIKPKMKDSIENSYASNPQAKQFIDEAVAAYIKEQAEGDNNVSAEDAKKFIINSIVNSQYDTDLEKATKGMQATEQAIVAMSTSHCAAFTAMKEFIDKKGCFDKDSGEQVDFSKGEQFCLEIAEATTNLTDSGPAQLEVKTAADAESVQWQQQIAEAQAKLNKIAAQANEDISAIFDPLNQALINSIKGANAKVAPKNEGVPPLDLD